MIESSSAVFIPTHSCSWFSIAVTQLFAGARRLMREWQTGALTLAQTYAGTATVFVENLAPANSKS